jgi:excisionase family DNA binding protein
MKLLTTAQVAERLGVHRTRVNVLIQEGRLPAQKFGRAYLVQEKDLQLVSHRPVGRPPKDAKGQGSKKHVKA